MPMQPGNDKEALSVADFDAIVCDLDGVITQTARVHAAAWKQMFDAFLAERATDENPFEAFDPDHDYREYVDGKPRYDGVRSFLASRGIELPEGSPQDPPGMQSICALGNRKNALFLEQLHARGADVYRSSTELIRQLRELGLATAVVSSSRNCGEILEAADIADLFDARVDGLDLEQTGMAGKPAPDMFVEALRRLECDPRRSVGVEDATAGVQALRAADFGLVIGVNRNDHAPALLEHGADIVVADLGELALVDQRVDAKTPAQALPEARDRLSAILGSGERKPVVFLDYDGTLTPIVDRPEDATLSDRMRTILRRLRTVSEVAIISGRDLPDVRERVGLANLWYAGSHGFDILGPNGRRSALQQGEAYLPELDAAEQQLRAKLETVSGCLLERKRFSIAVHYRQVAGEDLETVGSAVEQVQAEHADLRISSGKKLFELQPDIDWDKGRALHWLMQTLGLNSEHALPIYIGDDTTDEDAFRALHDEGVGIIVAQDDQPTCAGYRLAGPGAVADFLSALAHRLGAAPE